MSAGTLKCFGDDCAHVCVFMCMHVYSQKNVSLHRAHGQDVSWQALVRGAQEFFRLFWKLCCKGGTFKFF